MTEPATPLPATTSPTAEPAAPDGARAYEAVRKLAEEIGPRLAGTAGEIAARDFIKGELERDGYDVTLQDFGFDASDFLPARVDANGETIPAFTLRGSGSGTVHGRLVHAGNGSAADIPAAGLSGEIALFERGVATFGEKVGNAIRAGAAGVVMYNNDAGSLLGGLPEAVAIPVVSIRQDAGQGLAAAADAAVIDATIAVSPPRGTAYNVVAKPKGVTTCATVTGGHYDSVAVTGGADDNASGAAAVLEVARVLAAGGAGGQNCFVLFGAEEFGLFGSRAFVESLTPEQLGALRAMVNLDVVGVSGPMELVGSDDLVDTARIAGEKAGVSATRATLPPGTGSDHLSFQNAGVPVVMLTREDRLIHTSADTIERVLPASLRETVVLALATLDALGSR